MATGACAVLCWPVHWMALSRVSGGEGGDCGRGVALLARAPERTHCLELLLGEQGGSHLVAGQTGSDGDRQNGAAGSAFSGTSPRHSKSRGAAIGSVCCSAFQCAGTSVRPSASAAASVSSNTKIQWPWWRQRARASGLQSRGSAPVRAVAGPDKARDIHERLRQTSISMRPATAAASAPAPARQVRRQVTKDAGAGTWPASRSSDRVRQLERAGLPADQCGQVSPCTATWRRPLPMTP